MLLNSNLRYDSSIGLSISVTLNGVEWLCNAFCCCRLCKCCKLAKLWLFDDFGDKLITKSTPFKSCRRLCSWGSSVKVPELIASIVDMRFFLLNSSSVFFCCVDSNSIANSMCFFLFLSSINLFIIPFGYSFYIDTFCFEP